MPEWEQKVKDKIKENNLDPKIGEILWKVLSDSANYQFAKCLSPETVIQKEDGYVCLAEVKVGDKILALDTKNDKNHFVEVARVLEKEAEIFEFEMENGSVIQCSMDHKFLCEDNKMRPIKEVLKKNLNIKCNPEYGIT